MEKYQKTAEYYDSEDCEFYLDFFKISYFTKNNIPHSFRTMGHEAVLKDRFRPL